MKKILSLIGVAALLATVTAQAGPTENSQPITLQLPQVAANMTTNLISSTNTVLLYSGKQQNLAMEFDTAFSVAGDAAGLTNAIYKLAPTIDGVTFDTNNAVTVTSLYEQATAGQVQRWSTNLNTAGRMGWVIYSIQNTHATGVLTNSVKTLQKIGWP